MHFSLIVALPEGIPADAEMLRAALEQAMEPFDEAKEVDEYVYETREELMADERFMQWWDENKPMDYATAVRNWDGLEVDSEGNVLTTSNPQGEWDWWVVGGRWGSGWTLREGAPDGPLDTEPSSFGYTERADSNPRATDCARWCDLMPESVEPPYTWLDLDGQWHTNWLGPNGSGSSDPAQWERGKEHETEFMKFLANLPPATWLVHCDYHA